MRVIAGYLGGRNFYSPKAFRTHPMSERVRGGLFNSLGDIKGLSVLDVFAGSGALAIEAISRGAESATTIESNKTAHNIIKDNIKTLGIEHKVKATKAFFNSWSTRNEKQKFDIVIADPPYSDLPYKEVEKLNRHIKDDSTIVLSWPGNMKPLKLKDLEIVKNKSYGDAQLVFYQKVR